MDQSTSSEKLPKKRRNKQHIIAAIAVAVIAIGAGFWAWHETPGFCGSICHTPMSSYVDSYYDESGATLASVHATAGKTCLDCHPAEIDQQISEAVHWMSGDYAFDTETEKLVSRGHEFTTQENCLKSGCHSLDLDRLKNKTAYLAWNPHDFSEHGVTDCSSCHKMHGTSQNVCSECHYQAADMTIEGWENVPYRLEK
ncbi:MAG: cytochrome c3 family protein [Berryella intestinalis]|uniref:cytochrome c3 family protein n=1 Tax=Berryella intestinalis TaxID=1531429 RepID=UPI002A5702A9|nr:cytochrome c3 family protein [Berryella intestinalis]MDD7368630.1 cytochrome c3 family protein [Berryella intestinalis]MDY3130062.1 cytochrome c3 family protein [Berryella intestinalis]